MAVPQMPLSPPPLSLDSGISRRVSWLKQLRLLNHPTADKASTWHGHHNAPWVVTAGLTRKTRLWTQSILS